MAVTLTSYNYFQDRARLGKASLATVRAMVSAVDGDLAAVQAALLVLATSPSLQSGDLSDFYVQAKDVLTTLSATNIVLVDPTFQQRINTLRPYGSELPRQLDLVSQLKQVFKTGRSIATDVFFAPLLNKPFLAVGVPVYRNGVVTYVLAAGVSPQRLSGLLAQQHFSADWIGVILDSSGTVVARTHQMERYVGTKGSPSLMARMAQVPEDAFENKTLEGIPVFAAFSKSNVSNWTVAIGIPAKTMTGELVSTLWWFVGGTVFLLLSGLAVAWAIGSRIAASIHKLIAPALALGSGKEVIIPALHLKEAEEVGNALARASAMLMEAQYKSNHDPLTGLANRALYDEILNHQIAICQRTKTTLAIVSIDLDGFKAVNDAHGHAAGDKVLCTVATRLKNAIRKSDLAARLGGDEFALILVHTGLAAAETVAAKLVNSLSGPYPIGERTLEISASVGIAVYPGSGTTFEELSRHADEAMYAAKASGKQHYAA